MASSHVPLSKWHLLSSDSYERQLHDIGTLSRGLRKNLTECVLFVVLQLAFERPASFPWVFLWIPTMSTSSETNTVLEPETKKQSWLGYLWDTADSSAHERRMLFKVDTSLLLFASVCRRQFYSDRYLLNTGFAVGLFHQESGPGMLVPRRQNSNYTLIVALDERYQRGWYSRFQR